MDASGNLARLRESLIERDVAAIALTNVFNVAYVTGFEDLFDDEDAHIALVTADSAQFFTDSRYAEAARRAAADTPWSVHVAKADLVGEVCDFMRDAGVARVALETSLPHGRFVAFESRFEGEVVPAEGWVETLRSVKSAEEIERVAAAQAITDLAFEHILGHVRVGATEAEVALELEFFMRTHGSDGIAFTPIVAGGPNAALPHARPGARPFEDGDLVVLDFGARVGGYCADMTRTVCVGRASAEHRRLYETVLQANLAGISAVRAGVVGRDADAAARAVISEAGFGQYFGHGLGHGVGREVHEQPSLGPRADKALPAGAIVTIEPGIYIPEFGGARIEDLAVVEEQGVRILTASPKDLIEL